MLLSNFQAKNPKKQEEILKKIVKVAFLRLVCLSEHYDLKKIDLYQFQFELLFPGLFKV